MKILQLIFSIFLLLKSFAIVTTDADYSLKAISVIFRHGDRLPDPAPTGFYPNDPYKNVSFDPLKPGDLTNNGKMREYKLGMQLRNRYNSFLGDTYRPSDVSAISTDFSRTKMSLLLVLAALYTPKKKQVWNQFLNWQPIPANILTSDLSSYMIRSKCPTWQEEFDRIKNTMEYKEELSHFGKLMKNLTVLTGLYMNESRSVYNLYHTLVAEQSMNLTLPDWTKDYFPDGPIIDATIFEYKIRSYTKLLTKLNGGLFLRKILDSTVEANEKDKIPKAHLYGVHEYTVVGLLQALGLWNNIIPEYSSAVVVELHEKNSKYFMKIVYYRGIPAEFEEMTIPGCTEYCPLDDFLKLKQDVLPNDLLEACFGPPDNSYLIPKSVDPNQWIYGKIRKWFNL